MTNMSWRTKFFPIHYAYCCELFAYLILFEFPWWHILHLAMRGKDQEGFVSAENSLQIIFSSILSLNDKTVHLECKWNFPEAPA